MNKGADCWWRTKPTNCVYPMKYPREWSSRSSLTCSIFFFPPHSALLWPIGPGFNTSQVHLFSFMLETPNWDSLRCNYCFRFSFRFSSENIMFLRDRESHFSCSISLQSIICNRPLSLLSLRNFNFHAFKKKSKSLVADVRCTQNLAGGISLAWSHAYMNSVRCEDGALKDVLF